MDWRRFLGSVLAIGVAACDPSPGPFTEDLPKGAYLYTETETVVFPLRVAGETHVRDVVFVNGGLQKVRLRDVRLEQSGAAFEVLSTVPRFPDVREIEPRGALGVRVQFESPGRGVVMATLVVESDAANNQAMEIELVGLGADEPLPAVPDIARFESNVEITERSGFDVPVALARFANLGGETLELTQYTLDDTVGFRILPGTPIPSVSCDPAGACDPPAGAAQGCCDLACRGTCNGGLWDGQACSSPCPGLKLGDPEVECLDLTCAPVRAVSGGYVVVPLGFADPNGAGAYGFSLTVHSNDGNPTVHVSGVLE
jgi:hypothetical protein